MLHSYRFLPILLLFSFILILQQNCVAQQTLEGFACTQNTECGKDLNGKDIPCVSGRCGACTSDGDCDARNKGSVCCAPKVADAGPGQIKERYCRPSSNQCDTREPVGETTSVEKSTSDGGEPNPEPTPELQAESTADTKTCNPACEESKDEVCCDDACKPALACLSLKDCNSEKDCPVGHFCCSRPIANYSKCLSFEITTIGTKCVKNTQP